jgi:glycosyltransferase involved in cell wall biosynthesis
VISDNASTDGTRSICESFASKDSRVRYFRFEENIGGPKNFCRVAGLCHGQYLKWSAADDYWAANMLEKCVSVLDSDPETVLCYPWTRLIDAEGRLLEVYQDQLHLQDPRPSNRFIKVLEIGGLCNASYGVIRMSALRKTQMMTCELGADYHFLAELALYGKFHVVPEVLYSRRFHPGCSSWDRTNPERQRKFYSPGERRDQELHAWKRIRKLFSVVGHAQLGAKEKLNAIRYLVRFTSWDRHALFSELCSLARKLLHRGVPKAGF